MRFVGTALISFAILAGPVVAQAPQSVATDASAPAHYTTADTDIGTLLDDPAAKAIVTKYLPQLTSNDQIDQARPMTLKAIQPFASDMITDEALAKIDADLAKIPVKH